MNLPSLLRPALAEIKPYPVLDSHGMIKLDAMENPFSLPLQAQADLMARLSHLEINRYPDPAQKELKAALIRAQLASQNFPLIIGNGSDEIIAMMHGILREHSKVMAFDPSFSMYELNAKTSGHTFIKVALNEDFSINLDRTLSAIDKEQPSLLWIAYPNNPTGNVFEHRALSAIIEAHKGIAIIDEAYLPFTGGDSLIDWLGTSPKIAIMRTLSKLGLAGLRVGYLMGSPELITALEKARLPFNTNRLSAEFTKIILQDYHPQLIEQATQIAQEREKMFRFFQDWQHLHPKFRVRVFPSKANFLLVHCECASALYQWLRQQKILIKDVSNASPLLSQCLRFSIGTADQNQAVRNAVSTFQPH